MGKSSTLANLGKYYCFWPKRGGGVRFELGQKKNTTIRLFSTKQREVQNKWTDEKGTEGGCKQKFTTKGGVPPSENEITFSCLPFAVLFIRCFYEGVRPYVNGSRLVCKKKNDLPVCVLWWAFRCELFVYTFLHPRNWHLCIRRLESGEWSNLQPAKHFEIRSKLERGRHWPSFGGRLRVCASRACAWYHGDESGEAGGPQPHYGVSRVSSWGQP